MILKGIILAMGCSFSSLTIHFIISYFKKAGDINKPSIFKLLRQSRLIAIIWFFTFLIYGVLVFWPQDKINILVDKLNVFNEKIGFSYGIIFYLFLSFFYLTVYYLIDRSVSATLLEIIDNAPEKKLPIDEIKKIYDVEKKYQTELKGMLEGRFIIKEGDKYRNSLKGFLYAQMAVAIKRLLKLGVGG